MSRLLLSHQFRLREMGMSSDSSLGGQSYRRERENGKMVYLFICVHVHAGSHGHDFAVAPNNIKWAKIPNLLVKIRYYSITNVSIVSSKNHKNM